MDVKAAITLAKRYISDIYEDEGVFNIGLEEVEYTNSGWEVTVGFSRRWDRPSVSALSSIALGQSPDHRALARTYKIVSIDNESETVTGVSNRLGLT